MKKVALIIGYGKSGKAAAKLAEKKCYDVVVADRNFTKDYRCVSDHEILDPKLFDLVIVSPGIDSKNSLYSHMKRYHPNVVGEAGFALSSLDQICFAITGSNGKTTTTLFLKHLLNTSGKKAKALGNVGFPLSEYALNPIENEILICELSSFQLETLRGNYFDGAALLNITPDHLDRYDSFDAYAKAKCNLFYCLKQNAKVIVSSRDATKYKDLIDFTKADIFYPEDYQELFEQTNFDRHTLCWMRKLSDFFAIPFSDFKKAVKSFVKPFHRLEFVNKIRGVSYYNDSKATNLASVDFALKSFSDPLHLIAGGKDKGFDFSELKNSVSKKVKTIFAIGEMQEKIYMSLNKHVKVLKVESLDRAIKMAYEISCPGEIVLLSPGCSSYDQFDHFEKRGEMFKKHVLELKQRDAL